MHESDYLFSRIMAGVLYINNNLQFLCLLLIFVTREKLDTNMLKSKLDGFKSEFVTLKFSQLYLSEYHRQHVSKYWQIQFNDLPSSTLLASIFFFLLLQADKKIKPVLRICVVLWDKNYHWKLHNHKKHNQAQIITINSAVKSWEYAVNLRDVSWCELGIFVLLYKH